ncbi:MAG: isopentenyl phosphate kinase [Candidatus Moraniibacteriota bacterium]
MKPLYILKIGGSVVTCKDEPDIVVRHDLLRKIALAIKKVQKKENFDLIIIHGAGSVGHRLAKKYNIANGINDGKNKVEKALITCNAIQELDNVLCKIFVTSGVRAFPIHTASAIIQKERKIIYCNLKMIKEALNRNCLPILYGDMVFADTLGMSACSGDDIASFLTKKLGARKLFFASDIDGVFDRDPHLHRDAKLLEKVLLRDILNDKKIKITQSHSTDITGGLWGKIKSLDLKHNDSLETIEIFNGMYEKNYAIIFSGKSFAHTIIKVS